MNAIPTISAIERDLEQRSLWLCVVSNVELTKRGKKYTWIARIYRGREEIAKARRDTQNAAKRAAYELVKGE